MLTSGDCIESITSLTFQHFECKCLVIYFNQFHSNVECIYFVRNHVASYLISIVIRLIGFHPNVNHSFQVMAIKCIIYTIVLIRFVQFCFVFIIARSFFFSQFILIHFDQITVISACCALLFNRVAVAVTVAAVAAAAAAVVVDSCHFGWLFIPSVFTMKNTLIISSWHNNLFNVIFIQSRCLFTMISLT